MSATAAAVRARRLYPKSQAFQTAYVRGYAAARSGRPITACPYGRRVAGRRAVGWSMPFKAAWIAGWSSFDRFPEHD